MSPRRIRSCIWLLLPLIALRGLLPAGSMIDVTANGLALVVCESGIDAASASRDAHHHHAGSESSGRAEHSICPFAIAATGVSAPCLPTVVAVAAIVIDRVYIRIETANSLSGPWRAQQSRAPPAFS